MHCNCVLVPVGVCLIRKSCDPLGYIERRLIEAKGFLHACIHLQYVHPPVPGIYPSVSVSKPPSDSLKWLKLTQDHEDFELKKALLCILTTLSTDRTAVKVRRGRRGVLQTSFLIFRPRSPCEREGKESGLPLNSRPSWVLSLPSAWTVPLSGCLINISNSTHSLEISCALSQCF